MKFKIKIHDFGTKMFQILEEVVGIFSRAELETAVPVHNVCTKCKKDCGHLFKLDCGSQMCGVCLDALYDSYNECVGEELFVCPCHSKPVSEYTVC